VKELQNKPDNEEKTMLEETEPVNLDEFIEDADWPKRTPDRMVDIENKLEENRENENE
jgi:hypothetical protein